MARNQEKCPAHAKHFVLSDNWAEPYTLDELAVDRKKVTELSAWISSHRNKCGILLLTGPTGCGKTASVKCVARSLGFEVREWVTPLDRDFQNSADVGVYQSQTEKFEDYLYSCSRYADLFVQASNAATLLLVEDYPNIFILKPEIFHDVMRRYCGTARAPIIFICSDVADQGLNLELTLFPLNVQRNVGITHVSLNPVTRAKMLNALKRMVAYLQTVSIDYKSPTADILNEICDSSGGDVRYAMLSLQMKPQEDVVALFDFAGKKAHTKKRIAFQKISQEEKAVTACGKDDRVGILRSVGRVLFPKWREGGDKLLHNTVKRKRKGDGRHLDASAPNVEWIHDPNGISDTYLSSSSNFLLLVQENYVKTFSTIESVSAAALYLSDADVMMKSEGVEVSHEISFNVAVRGVMVQNKLPHRTFNAIKGSRHYEMVTTQKKLSALTETLFPLYPVSHTVLMTDIVPYMALSSGNCLSNDQHKFVSAIASMEPLSAFCESFRSFKEPYGQKKVDKVTFVMDSRKDKPPDLDDELHISEDESGEETDEGAQNLTLLEAAMAEDEEVYENSKGLSMPEEKQEIDYNALLNDSDDDILLSQI